MELMRLKEDVAALIYMMKRMMDVDFVVVDNHLNTLVNTFEYDREPLDVQANSVVGNVIVTGQAEIVGDKRDFKKCVNCPQFMECKIESIAGVPINTSAGRVGAVALLFRERNRQQYPWSLDDAMELLNEMVKMLADKIQNQVYEQEVTGFSRFFSRVFGHVKEAAALTDERRHITYANGSFTRFFGDGDEVMGKHIEELMQKKSGGELLNGQDYSPGMRFDKPNQTGIQLILLQKIEAANNRDCYLYIFENINISILRSKQAKLYDLRKWIASSFSVSPMMELAREAAEQAVENELSVLIEGPYEYQNNELGRMYLIKGAADGDGILEINCSKEDRVLEQELFGLNKNITGMLDMARGKAIGLYSIEHLPMYLQKKIADSLIVNQMQGQYGMNIRIIATSERSLSGLVDRELFSEKLYYYISRNQIRIPDIDHEEDVLHQLEKYIKYYGNIYRKTNVKVRDEAWKYLKECTWSDGRNTMKQFIELLMINLNGNVVTVDAVKMTQIKYGLRDVGGITDENEERIRKLLLDRSKSKKEIAEELGIGRATLYRWFKKYNL